MHVEWNGMMREHETQNPVFYTKSQVKSVWSMVVDKYLCDVLLCNRYIRTYDESSLPFWTGKEG